MHPLFKHLHWRSERERQEDNQEDDEEEEGREKEATTDLLKTKAQLLVKGQYISPVYFDEITSGLTNQVIVRHEEMIGEATSKLVSVNKTA